MFPELEGLLISHPKVKDAAVIGVYRTDLATEVPRAYVVPELGVQRSEQTAQEIEGWLRERVARQKWLRGGVRFIDAIPSNPSGKLLRRELKLMAEAEQRAIAAKL